jgi:kelch-like protein 10
MGNVDLNQENVCPLLASADYMIVTDLLELCPDFFSSTLAIENPIGIMRFARDYYSSLERDARCFVMGNFVQVSQQNDELLELPPEELQAMIGADELNVKSEDNMLEGFLRWINHDVEKTKCQLLGFMKEVRLGPLDGRSWRLALFFRSLIISRSKLSARTDRTTPRERQWKCEALSYKM